ncbi:phage gp6-like head-tail connector protein [Streptomyces sp. MUM 16J]|uniref:phage gp6-like head-tail connector protein n=1 Tax=Streptomyces sp. MUM 16J TaxID=2791988 RepID=UPI001F04AC71|nr:phage gp6-like head-tail connector protein [Streptomyces sp. MUM 16J]MCH0555813.1 phage gp6-like head-tail connector protein [Streptomyces sp. MUM 16J]
MALIYYSGQDVQLSVTVLDDTGAPATGAVSVDVTVTDPSGTVTTPATASAGGGVYTAVVSSAAVDGTWLVRWTATGTGVGFVDEGQFDVRPLGIEQIVDLASVKAHLNIPTSDTSHDAELQGFILAAADQARDVVGPVVAEQHTEWHNGGSASITVDWLPLASVQSVTEYIGPTAWALTEQPLGSSSDAYGYSVDVDRGQIIRRAVGSAVSFPHGIKNVKVVYTAGRAGSIPWTVRLGSLELIRHLYQLTQQGGRPRFGGAALDGEGAAVPSGFALPARVLELWQPFKRPPGVA